MKIDLAVLRVCGTDVVSDFICKVSSFHLQQFN